MIPVLFIFKNWALLLLRFVVGFIFLSRGWLKFKNEDRPTHWLCRYSVAAIESIGGALLVLGLWTQIIGVFLALYAFIFMAWKIILRNKRKSDQLDLLLIASLLVLATMGGGLFAFMF